MMSPDPGRDPGGALPVDVLPGPDGAAPACRLLKHFVRSTALLIAKQACSCWARDCVPAAPAPEPVEPEAPGAEGDGGADICANATLLVRAAAATKTTVLYMRYLRRLR